MINCTIVQCKKMFCFGVPAFPNICVIVREKKKTSNYEASRGG